jgi:hypothetical protein
VLAYRLAPIGVGILAAILSIQPNRKMPSPAQVMNTVYNRFHLVGTYGAFGPITRPRYQVIVEGTDEPVVTASTKWREDDFEGKPGSLGRRPPQIAPYHLRLDWLMWFAPCMAKLLEGDRPVLSLPRTNPFRDRPPRCVRALLYEYRFTSPAERAATAQWRQGKLVGPCFPPISLQGGRALARAELQLRPADHLTHADQ